MSKINITTPNAALVAQVKDLRGKSADEIARELRIGIQAMGVDPSLEQTQAWRGSWPHVQNVIAQLPDDVWVAFEYRLPMSHQRIDLLFLGQNQAGRPVAVVLELKGWRQVQSLKVKGLVRADEENHQHPDIQAADYVGKLRYTHSEAHRFDLHGAAWLYNAPPGSLVFTKSTPFFANEDPKLATYLNALMVGGISAGLVQKFIQGTYVQTMHLIKAIHDNFEVLRQGAITALSTKGFAPSEEQQIILENVLQAVRKGEPTAFLIQGEPGSGKSYLAVMLLLKALADANQLGARRQNIAVLGYRNNRLLNTVRRVFQEVEPGLDGAVKFFSAYNQGLADNNPRIPTFKLAIFDEAQRLAPQHVAHAMRRGVVTVFLYDEGQRLNLDEGGTGDALRKAARWAKRRIVEYHLQGVYRVQGGVRYHRFVEALITDPRKIDMPCAFPNYDFRIFTDIAEMIQHLRDKAQDHHVALVAAFTESPGDRSDKQGKTLKNRRIGYPLYSGFDRYKDRDLDIYWLMDEKTQYPNFWYRKTSNTLEHCASIYGCQGFEADYVGVIWGRDFVWDPQEERWTLGPNCEDSIGRPSLKDLFKNRNEKRALPLLRNRYRIFLTRGIHGTYIYCEDEDTAQLLQAVYKSCGKVSHPT